MFSLNLVTILQIVISIRVFGTDMLNFELLIMNHNIVFVSRVIEYKLKFPWRVV